MNTVISVKCARMIDCFPQDFTLKSLTSWWIIPQKTKILSATNFLFQYIPKVITYLLLKSFTFAWTLKYSLIPDMYVTEVVTRQLKSRMYLTCDHNTDASLLCSAAINGFCLYRLKGKKLKREKSGGTLRLRIKSTKQKKKEKDKDKEKEKKEEKKKDKDKKKNKKLAQSSDSQSSPAAESKFRICSFNLGLIIKDRYNYVLEYHKYSNNSLSLVTPLYQSPRGSLGISSF